MCDVVIFLKLDRVTGSICLSVTWPEIIFFFILNSSEHELSTTHETKMLKGVLALKLSNAVFILLMLNLTFIYKMNFHAQLSSV